MSDANLLPDCLALRIGLAARALPDTSPAELVRVLIAVLGEPLTEAKLNSVKIRDLKTGADGALSEIDNVAALRQALQFLHGEDDASALSAVPTPGEYDDSLPGSIQIACASNTGERLDGHFGSCARFLVYQVSATAARLIAVRTAPATAKLSVDHSAERVALINDCDLLAVLSIGGPAAARVINSGIHPFKRPQAEDISGLLAELQRVLASDHPPPWLAKRRDRTIGEPPPETMDIAP
jgi:nitrogen fixation protein NifX